MMANAPYLRGTTVFTAYSLDLTPEVCTLTYPAIDGSNFRGKDDREVDLTFEDMSIDLQSTEIVPILF